MKKSKKLSVKMTVYCLLFAFFLSVFIGVFSMITHYYNSLKHYKEYIRTMLISSRYYIDAEKLRELAFAEDLPEYYENIQKLYDTIIDTTEFESIYILSPDEAGIYWYILCGLSREEKAGFPPDVTRHVPLEEETEENVVSMYRQIMNHEIEIGYVTNRFQSHYILSGVIPVFSGDEIIGLMGADISIKDITDNMMDFALSLLVGIVAAGLFFMMFFLLKIRKSVVSPIIQIVRHVQSFVDKIKAEEIHTAYTEIKVKTRDEIELLSEGVSHMMQEMVAYIESLDAYSLMQDQFDTQLKLSGQILEGIIPNVFPAFPERNEFDIYGLIKAENKVSSEFFDFFFIDGTHLGVILFEVSGEGVPAALFMMMARTMLRNYAKLFLEPAKILMNVNNDLYESNQAEMKAGAFIGIFDLYSGLFTYANAGRHSFSVIDNTGASDRIQIEDGFQMGMLKNLSYHQETITVGRGSKVLFHSDRVLDIGQYDFYQTSADIISRQESIMDALKLVLKDVVQKMEEDGMQGDLTLLLLEYR